MIGKPSPRYPMGDVQVLYKQLRDTCAELLNAFGISVDAIEKYHDADCELFKDSGATFSHILFQSGNLQRVAELLSCLKSSRRAHNNEESKDEAKIKRIIFALLEGWRDEILQTAIPRPRGIFDFVAFERAPFLWSEWAQYYLMSCHYSDIYPLFSETIMKYTCKHMTALVDFFVTTSNTVQEACYLLKDSDKSAGIMRYTIPFLSIFCRFAVTYTLGMERTFCTFETSSMLRCRHKYQIGCLLKHLKDRNFIVVFEEGNRVEFGSARFSDPDFQFRFREVTVSNDPSYFGDDLVVSLFARPRDIIFHHFERALYHKPLLSTQYPEDIVIVTGRNTFLSKKWVHNLTVAIGTEVLHWHFCENQAVDAICREWTKEYTNLLFCHVYLIDHGLAGDIFEDEKFRYLYGMVHHSIRIIYTALIELKRYFKPTLRLVFWQFIVRKSCEFLRHACNNPRLAAEGVQSQLFLLLTTVCGTAQIVSRAKEEFPDIEIGHQSVADLKASLYILRNLNDTNAIADQSLLFDLQSCIQTLFLLVLRFENTPVPASLMATPNSMIQVSEKHKIFKGFDQEIGRLIVYKEVKPVTDEKLVGEIDFLKFLQYHDVVECYGLHVTDNATFLKLEYCPLRSLGDLINATGPYRIAPQVARLGFLVLKTLGFLHANMVVHGALTPSNILIDAFGVTRLTDFGCARYVAPSTVQYSNGMVHANTAFLAPETVKTGTTTMASDIWALGCIFFFVMTGQHPYSECPNQIAIMHKLGSGEVFDLTLLENCCKTFGDDIVTIVKQCLSVDPSSRPTSFALRMHPFFYIPLPT